MAERTNRCTASMGLVLGERPEKVKCLARAHQLDGQHVLNVFNHTQARALAHPPIDTWSSCPADVGIESTDAGWQRPLFSETSEAAVTCAIRVPSQARHASQERAADGR